MLRKSSMLRKSTFSRHASNWHFASCSGQCSKFKYFQCSQLLQNFQTFQHISNTRTDQKPSKVFKKIKQIPSGPSWGLESYTVTIGLTLGGTRELSFVHWQTGLTCSFPQRNGDIFAFTPELNQVFLHGVPKVDRGPTKRDHREDCWGCF